ncbi:hypothetical protein HK099_001005 [Clydaea vesicula]|uniref:Adhesin domain-containing protein n=1 Tax=Clydaea vesicula TaxID=447962 RepID=A0AAD5Y200_9FUNG|nr:hypothetical protein HK099_001005 [Clydaea vesicula]KAJ3396541.1 hypothetical protein HDU92_002721 [Lobulomyces angularis]
MENSSLLTGEHVQRTSRKRKLIIGFSCVALITVITILLFSNKHKVPFDNGENQDDSVIPETPLLFSKFYPSENPFHPKDPSVDKVEILFEGAGEGLIQVSVEEASSVSAVLDFDLFPFQKMRDMITITENTVGKKYTLRVQTPSRLENYHCSVVGNCGLNFLDSVRNEHCYFYRTGRCEKILIKIDLKIPSHLKSFVINSGVVSISNINNSPLHLSEGTQLKTTVGSIVFDNGISAENGYANFQSTVGKISVKNVNSDKSKFETTVGSISIKDSSFKNLDTITDVGSIYGSNLKLKSNLFSRGRVGSTEFKSLDLTNNYDGKLDLHSEVGSVNLDVINFKGEFQLDTKLASISVTGDNITFDKKEGWLDRHWKGHVNAKKPSESDIIISTNVGGVKLSLN